MAFSWRKKVIDKAEVEEEMSMEEILSSIRKYVIDEKGPTIATTTPSPITSPFVRDEDIIELMQPLDKPEALPKKDPQATTTSSVVTPILSATAPKQKSAPDDVTETPPTPTKTDIPSPSQPNTRAANVQPITVPQPPIQVKRQPHTPFQSAQYPFHPMPSLPSQQPPKTVEPSKATTEPLTSSHDPLVSTKTASETAQAFARLAEVAQQPPAERKLVLTGDTTIEQLVTEITKPIIKTWLDENLAPIVEIMVAKEIERITRR